MERIRDKLLENKEKLALVGLGYVGLPVAAAFAERGVDVIGFDINEKKISALKDGIDVTGEVSRERLKSLSSHLLLTHDLSALRDARFIIVAVPTPIDEHKTPDLRPLETASKMVGQNMAKGTCVVYESTVYPGVTEEFCLPILEQCSGLSWKEGDFSIGYSPERINPGDREHTMDKVIKIVSGQNREVCGEIAEVYELVARAGVHRAENIKVAEAAKVIENTQRDLNIALMNELAIIFEKIGISTEAVLKAAGTKWNFLNFRPGLVGGHCIGVDPFYLTSKAEQLGYHPQVVLAGRRINDSMGTYIAQQTVKQMVKARKTVEGSRVLVLGLTFKEDVPDFRNSRVIDIIRELRTYGIRVVAHDPYYQEGSHSPSEVEHVALTDARDIDGIIAATPHRQFRELKPETLMQFCRSGNGQAVLIDVKWIFDETEAKRAGFAYWRL